MEYFGIYLSTFIFICFVSACICAGCGQNKHYHQSPYQNNYTQVPQPQPTRRLTAEEIYGPYDPDKYG